MSVEVIEVERSGDVAADSALAMTMPRQIICLSSVDWTFNWQVPQEVMARFAAAGHTVLYIENTGVRMPRWRDLPRLRRRFLDWRSGTQGFRQVQENLHVCSPLLLPFPYSRLAQWINRGIFLASIRRWMRILGVERPIVWTFLPTGLALELIRTLDPTLVVYYCLADFEQLGPVRKVRRAEQALLQRADVVFAQGEMLAQRCRIYHKRPVAVFPSGVNVERFQESGSWTTPADLTTIRSPRIGYVGALQRHVDGALLSALAQRHPEWELVIVGPQVPEFTQDLRAPNVHLLGAKLHAEVPRYIAAFDVCLIPYALTDYTQTVYPTKLTEYLILGKPVVSTPLPEVVAFNARYGSIVSIGRTVDEFEDRIAEAIRGHPVTQQHQRIRAAMQQSWAPRMAAMSRVLEERLQDADRLRNSQWPFLLRTSTQRAVRRSWRAIVAMVVLYIGVFHTPLVWWTASPLSTTEPPSRADAVVVFAGGVGESGLAGEGYRERMKHAIDLYRQGYVPRILFVSGYTYTFGEAEVMRMLTEGLGVPSRAILTEKQVGNTHDYVVRVGARAAAEGWRSLLLVTSPYHTRRAALTFARNCPDLDIRPMAMISSFYAHGWMIAPHQIRGILHEYLGILYYWWKGWL